MNPTWREDFKKAYKRERDIRVARRMIAVYDVRMLGMKDEDVAEQLMQCPSWVQKWVKRFDTDGLDGLRDPVPEDLR